MIGIFKKLLYPPRYLLMPAAGININDKCIRYLEFVKSHTGLSIQNYGEIALPENIIKEGEILNKNALTKILLDLKNKLSTTFINVSISEEKSYIFDCFVPHVEEKDIPQAIEFKLEENVPYKADEVYFEYELIKKPKIANEEILLSVAVVPKKIIDDYGEIMKSIGLSPVSFEVESRAIARSVIKDKSKNYLIININEDSSIFSLCTGNIVRLTSVMPIGSSVIKNNLLKIGKDLFDKDGRIIDEIFLSKTSYDDDTFSAFLGFYSILKDELNTFIEFTASKSNARNFLPEKIHKIILCGQSTFLPGFLNYMRQNSSTDVELANVWSNIFDLNQNVPEMKFSNSLDFATASGLALLNIHNA